MELLSKKFDILADAEQSSFMPNLEKIFHLGHFNQTIFESKVCVNIFQREELLFLFFLNLDCIILLK